MALCGATYAYFMADAQPATETDPAPPSATSAKTLRGGTVAHSLTTEDRRKGALRTNEIRRQKREEARKTALDRLTPRRHHRLIAEDCADWEGRIDSATWARV